MHATLRQTIEQSLTSLPEWDHVAVRGGGLTVTLVTTRMVLPLLGGIRPDATKQGAKEQDTVEKSLGPVLAQVQSLLPLLRRLIDDGVELARRRSIAATVSEIAGKLVYTATAGLQQGEPLSDLELEAVLATFLENRVPAGRVMDKDEFSAYDGLFADLWEREGEPAMQRWPHSIHGLGPDERPPLIGNGRENTWLGTERSVYSRYRLAANDIEVAGDADEIAQAEITRACGRWAVLSDSPFVVLRSLAAGLQRGPFHDGEIWFPAPPADRSWKSDPRPMAPSDSAEDTRTSTWVNEDLADLAQARIATFVRKTEQGAYLRSNGLIHEAHEHAMRRAWMKCFEFDRRARNIDAADGVRIVDLAIFKGIPSGQAHRAKHPRLDVTDVVIARCTQDEALDAPRSDPEEQFENSLDWLSDDRRRSRALLEDNVVAKDEYRRSEAEQNLMPLEDLLSRVRAPDGVVADEPPPDDDEGCNDA